MAIGKPDILSPEEHRRIEQAVQAAERGTRAEIIPMIVGRSGLYREVRHNTGLVAALLVLTGLLLWEASWSAWGWHAANAMWLLGATIVAYGLGAWLGTLPGLVPWMTTRERRRHKVRLRAERGFAQLGVAHTRERTGVLIMVSMLEREMDVIADHPISEVVPPEAWQAVVQAGRQAVEAGRVAEGLCASIARCGEVLARTAPAGPGDNPNELPDRVRVEP